MKLEQLQQKLLAAARNHPPSDRVPMAFEKRVLAHLQRSRSADPAALWARALWRAVIPCVAVSVVLLGSLLFVPANDVTSQAETSDLSQVFEQTLLASSADQAQWEDYW